MTLDRLLEGARANPGRIVVVGSENLEALEGVAMALEDEIVQGGTLIGDRAATLKLASQIGLPLDRFSFVECPGHAEAALQAARMIAGGEGDFLLKGQVDTKLYLKAILDKELHLVPQGSTLSHIAIMELPTYHKLLLSTDAAITIAPPVYEQVHLVQNAISMCHQLGITAPKIAMIAAVEKVNPKMTSTVFAREVVEHVKHHSICPRIAEALQSPIDGAHGACEHCGVVVEGPYDLYIATSAEGARVKNVSGQVCGDADVIVFPGINSANVFYKSVHRFVPGARVAGLIAGASRPIVLPSRADPAETKRWSIVAAAFLTGRSQVLHPPQGRQPVCAEASAVEGSAR